MTGPACGNNPNRLLTDGDRQAIAEFRAYLTDRAALLDGMVNALYDALYSITSVAGTHSVDERKGLRNAVRAVLAHSQDVLGKPPYDRSANALVEVRRFCTMTIEQSSRAQAIDQARDTLAVIDRVMGAAVAPAPDDQAAEITRLRIELGNTLKKAAADRCTDYAAGLRDAADIAEQQRQFEPAYGARKSAQVSENVGILRVAEELRRRADEVQPAETDTLAAWLHWRFGPHGQPWADVLDEDKALWEHQARAVRRAVARGGFKQRTVGERQDEADHLCNSVMARGHMDEPLGYYICGICGTPKSGAQQ
ncbi:hypothetical protein ACFUVV_00985 [Streptomyces sp. NPDC057376]|uniref:hypothetical protein n=1 Tax=Streptomyces sp. NPDC057376 TaxID=3346110 RepID=UPI0036392EA7